MKKLVQYIFALIILISLVHLTKDVVEFSKEIIILRDSQLKAKIKEERMMHPTVKITSLVSSGSSEAGASASIILSSATGFSVKYNVEENYSVIVTNDHFCEASRSDVSFMIEDYSKSSLETGGKYLDGEVILSVPNLDLCLIRARGYVKPAMLAGYHYTPRPFEEIFVVGGPSGTFPIIFDSYISKVIDRSSITLGRMGLEGGFLILLSEQVFPGHSGSPVFTKEGEVIGIIFGALRSYGGLAVSVKDIYLILEMANE